MIAGPSNYHGAYTASPHLVPVALQPIRYQGQHGPPAYYAHSVEVDAFGPTHATSSRAKLLSPAAFEAQHNIEAQRLAYEHGHPPPTSNGSFSRSYDTTITQYYPITTDTRWSVAQMTPEKDGTARKRRRGKGGRNTPPTAAPKPKALKTPKRSQSQEEVGSSRPTKRAKVDDDRATSAQPPVQTQLPTPPSTGKEVSHISLPQHIKAHVPSEDEFVPMSETLAESDAQRDSTDTIATQKPRGVVVTKQPGEGRKLGLIAHAPADTQEAPSSEETPPSPRSRVIPALTTGPSGQAIFSTHEVLESEIAWLENGGKVNTPPSSPDMIHLRTPTLTQDAMTSPSVNISPAAREEKINKRLSMFNEAEKSEEPMVSTRIEMFGRVAVRKNVAIKWLGLDRRANVVEEMQIDDDDPTDRTMTSSSLLMLRPRWPDSEVPWALAGGGMRDKRKREEKQKTATLKRYFETASDESSEDEETGMPLSWARGKGKSVQRLVRSVAPSETSDTRSHRHFDNPNADAKTALLTALRDRILPAVPVGRIDCSCGATTPLGNGPMIECSGCKSWHHLICCGIDEDSMLGPQWWCPQCQTTAIELSTPSRSQQRGYEQSDERSSAFKGESMANIALAPSPMFAHSSQYTQASLIPTRTPMNQVPVSPNQRQHRSRILSYGTDMWAYTEDGAPSSVAPSTPGPSRPDRYSTPRIDDAPFDVTSTPSRHLDFNFGQPSFFSLTPLGGRGRVTSGVNMMDGVQTPFARIGGRHPSFGGHHGPGQGAPMSEMVPSRHDFFRELNKGHSHPNQNQAPHSEGTMPQSPSSARWPHGLMGAHNVSPSPFGHRRNMSANKLSSMRIGSRSGLAPPAPLEESEEEKGE